jgi:hypothetical protein
MRGVRGSRGSDRYARQIRRQGRRHLDTLPYSLKQRRNIQVKRLSFYLLV